MSSLSRELVFLILQFLDEEKFKESVHKWVWNFFVSFMVFFGECFVFIWFGYEFEWYGNRLEQESGFFFNMKYFEEKAQAGEWDEVEKYLSGFTKVDDNRYSMKIFFEIRKQKYLEALDRFLLIFLCFFFFLNYFFLIFLCLVIDVYFGEFLVNNIYFLCFCCF